MRKQNGWFSMAIILIITASFAGYFSTRLVMGPIVDGSSGKSTTSAGISQKAEEVAKEQLEPQQQPDKVPVQPQTQPTSQPEVATQPQEAAAQPQAVKQLGPIVQFGRFSNSQSAVMTVGELKEKGIFSSIIKEEGAYLVVSGLYANKEAARSDVWKYQALGLDCFLTEKQI